MSQDVAARVDALKQEANAAFKRGAAGESEALRTAVTKYGKALKLASGLEEPYPDKLQSTRSATLLANRCQAHLLLGDVQAALADAEAAVLASPGWPKAYYRHGTVRPRDLARPMHMHALSLRSS